MMLQMIFRCSNPKYDEEQYLRARTILNRCIKILLIIILVFEIIIAYGDIEYFENVKLQIYNILFPFAICYLFFITRAARKKKEVLLTKTCSKKKNHKVNSDNNLISELWKEYYGIIASVMLPYTILKIELGENDNFTLLFISILFIVISIIGDLKKDLSSNIITVLLFGSLLIIVILNFITIIELVSLKTFPAVIILTGIIISYITAFAISYINIRLK